MSVYVKPPINQPPVAKGGLFSFVLSIMFFLKKYSFTKKTAMYTSSHYRNC